MLAGFVIFEILLVRLRPDEFERSILITLGLSIILIHTVQYLFTATPRMVDTQYGFDGVAIGTIAVTRREPSSIRSRCTIMSSADETCWRIARTGRSKPAIRTIVSRRARASRGEFA